MTGQQLGRPTLVIGAALLIQDLRVCDYCLVDLWPIVFVTDAITTCELMTVPNSNRASIRDLPHRSCTCLELDAQKTMARRSAAAFDQDTHPWK